MPINGDWHRQNPLPRSATCANALLGTPLTRSHAGTVRCHRTCVPPSPR